MDMMISKADMFASPLASTILGDEIGAPIIVVQIKWKRNFVKLEFLK